MVLALNNSFHFAAFSDDDEEDEEEEDEDEESPAKPVKKVKGMKVRYKDIKNNGPLYIVYCMYGRIGWVTAFN